MLRTTKLLGVAITNESSEKILEYVYAHTQTAQHKLFITTPNPEILVYAHKHPAYKRLLNQATISLPDGVGVSLASGLMGHPLRERIAGVDFMEELCRNADGKALSIGLLGGKSGVAKRTAECLKAKYPWLRVAFASSEWPNDANGIWQIAYGKDTEPYAIGHKQYATSIDILFVAFGFPKQEEWIYEHLDKLPVKVAMGVGGSFDFISGAVPRAPFLLRAIGLEWLFRLIRQPWRIKRQLALLEFIGLVSKERFGKHNAKRG